MAAKTNNFDEALEQFGCVVDATQKKQDAALADSITEQSLIRTLLQHEALRIEAKRGADDPRTRELKSQIALNEQLLTGLDVEREIASIKQPDTTADEALVHGRVVDSNRRGMAGLSVTLEDNESKAITARVRTDANGYYAVKIDERSLERKKDKFEAGVRVVVHREPEKLLAVDEASLTVTAGDRHVRTLVLLNETAQPVPEPRPPQDPPSDTTWTVRGRVVGKDRKPVEGLIVSCFDKDRRFDDKLGATLTNIRGEFHVVYILQDFKEGQEPGPDLYVTVANANGEELFSSIDNIRFNAGPDEKFQITIPARENVVKKKRPVAKKKRPVGKKKPPPKKKRKTKRRKS